MRNLKHKLSTFFLIFQIIFIFSFSIASNETDYSELWSALLKDNVVQGQKQDVKLNLVKYKDIKDDKRFKSLLLIIKKYDLASLKTNDQKLAFWINVYNIAAVKMIVDNYPIKSIKGKSFLFSSVWDMKILEVDGKEYALNEIEHNIIRKMGEPRIHFAIVCASISCPDLAMKPYVPQELNKQLDDTTFAFLFNKSKGLRIDEKNKTVYISKIFDWFKEDFDRSGGVKEFISKYVQKDVTKYHIRYIDYNWDLNG